MNDHSKAKALGCYIFSHKYFVPGLGCTNVYDPLAWSTADYFDPENDNGDVVWTIALELGLSLEDSEIWMSYLEMMTTTFELVKSETLNIDWGFRSPTDSSQLGWLKDETIEDLEYRRTEVAKHLMGISEEAVTRYHHKKYH